MQISAYVVRHVCSIFPVKWNKFKCELFGKHLIVIELSVFVD